MDKLINLVIIFIIFISIFKRLREVALKQQEIQKPREPSPLPGPFVETELPEGAVDMEPEEMVPSIETMPTEQVVPLEEMIERRIREVIEPEMSREIELPVEEVSSWPLEEQVSEPLPEVQPVAAVRPVGLVKKPPAPRRKSRTVLDFGSPGVIRGILMREILGPPVALRDDR